MLSSPWWSLVLPNDLARVAEGSGSPSVRNGRTKQFGWLQAAATKVSSLSITSANPSTINHPNL